MWILSLAISLMLMELDAFDPFSNTKDDEEGNPPWSQGGISRILSSIF